MAKQREQSLLFDAPGPKALKKIRIANIIAGCIFVICIIAILVRLSNPPEEKTNFLGHFGILHSNLKPGLIFIFLDYG